MKKRICVLIDDDVGKIIRTYQGKLISKDGITCSFSKALNYALRIALEKNIDLNKFR
ncbi:MAG: hypothetical protein OEL77_05990 [Nitrosopumilus sp.]|nr:hypothetical protein [Nitrosopumilus sp.]MDH3385545.1 hypothetical protein [Nitrosopumilus sp.]